MRSGTTANLHAIWGSGPADVFVVGDGTALHYDGSAWRSTSLETDQTLRFLWGTSATDVFAVGRDWFHYGPR